MTMTTKPIIVEVRYNLLNSHQINIGYIYIFIYFQC